MMKRRVPKRLWDYGIVWVCETMSLTANSSFALEGRTPIEQITGETPDISEYLDFGSTIGCGTKIMQGLAKTRSGAGLMCLTDFVT